MRYGFVTKENDLYIGDSYERAIQIKKELKLEANGCSLIYNKGSDEELLEFFTAMAETKGVKGEEINYANYGAVAS